MNSIMISVNPPYSKMILDGTKPIELRKQIMKDVKVGSKMFIYETKNKGGCGKVVAHCKVSQIQTPMYTKYPKDIETSYVKERFSLINNLYFWWCISNHITPNLHEGCFKSKKYKKYRDSIGFDNTNFNYALWLDDIVTFDKPLELSNFINSKGETMKYPPQNMCEANCEVVEENGGKYES